LPFVVTYYTGTVPNIFGKKNLSSAIIITIKKLPNVAIIYFVKLSVVVIVVATVAGITIPVHCCRLSSCEAEIF
jgi:hypothetical protein